MRGSYLRLRGGTSCEHLERRALLSAGDLDLSFGGDGRVEAGFGQQGGSGDVLVTPDGKLLSWRNQASRDSTWFTLYRLNADGTADESFGHSPDGITPSNIFPPFSETHGQAAAAAVQPDRKVLVAGSLGDNAAAPGFILRLREDGTPDPAFGGGDGIITAPPGSFIGLALDANGKILSTRNGSAYRFDADGSPDTSYGGGDGVAPIPAPAGTFAVSDLAVARDGVTLVLVGSVSPTAFGIAELDARGNPNPGFGGGDGVTTGAAGAGGLLDGAPAAVAIAPAGQIVLAGRRGGARGKFAVLRYTAGGTPDNTFSGDGIALVGRAATNPYERGALAVAVQADGKIVAGGDAGYGFSVVRFKAGGSLDPDFGAGGADGSGVASTHFLVEPSVHGGGSPPTGVAVQPGGRIVAVGSVSGADDGFSSWGHLTLARFLGDASDRVNDLAPDRSFGPGGNGVATAPVGANAAAGAIAELPGGGFVVAGTADNRFAAARYRADGRPDTAAGGGDGTWTIDFGAGPESARAVAAQPDGRIIFAGSANGRLALARTLANGTRDPSFDGDGRVISRLPSVRGGAGLVSVRTTAEVVAVDEEGKILVVGTQVSGYEDAFPFNALVIVRYNRDGTLDRTFGPGGADGDGVVSVSDRRTAGHALALLPGTGGDFLVAGSRSVAYDRGEYTTTFTVSRFRRDGSPYVYFGPNYTGTAEISFGNPFENSEARAVWLNEDGDIVVAGPTTEGDGVAVARLDASGQLDPDFGQGGKALPALGFAGLTGDWAAAPSGEGLTLAGTLRSTVAGAAAAGDVVLVHVNGVGAVDRDFGGGTGRIVADLGGDDRAGAIARTIDGRYVVAGSNSARFALAAFARADGTLGELVIEGTAGDDRISVDRTADRTGLEITVNGATRTVPLASVTRLVLRGLAGNDRIDVSPRVSLPATLDGGAGNDILKGGSGDDRILGGGGDDMLDGRGGADVFRGGDGRDGADYTGRAGAVFVNLEDGNADDGEAGEHDDVVVDVEDVYGGRGNDRLTGSFADNRLQGGAGDDVLVGGGGGRDALSGGAGDDALFSRDPVPHFENRDTVSGGDGNDEAEVDRFDVLLGVERTRA